MKEIESLIDESNPESLALEMLKHSRVPGAKAAFALVLRDDPEDGVEHMWFDGCGVQRQTLAYALLKLMVKMMVEAEDYEEP